MDPDVLARHERVIARHRKREEERKTRDVLESLGRKYGPLKPKEAAADEQKGTK